MIARDWIVAPSIGCSAENMRRIPLEITEMTRESIAEKWTLTITASNPHSSHVLITLQTTGTRLAATAAGEMTSISIGTRQRSV